MHVYCVSTDKKDAVTIGTILWMDAGTSFYEMNETQIIDMCRPRDASRTDAFMSYINDLKKVGPVTYVLSKDLPEGIKTRRGYWESSAGCPTPVRKVKKNARRN